MNRLFFWGLLIFGPAFFVLLSCKKIKHDKLEAKWRLVKVTEIKPADETIIWEFDEGILRWLKPDTIGFDTTEKGTYELATGLFNTRLKIDNLSDTNNIYIGTWAVELLRTTHLVIVNEDHEPFIYREFEKY